MGVAPYVTAGVKGDVSWMRVRGPAPRGMVLSPPLIGGHALLQFRMLRPLVRRRFDLLSFNYAGHGASKGAFSIQAALDNTLAILDLALEKSRKEGIPLYGFASCFAAIPLLHAVRQRAEPLSKMVLINAVPHLRGEKIVGDFLRYWQSGGLQRPAMRGVVTALRAYLDNLFPDTIHQHQAFGILSRQRIRWLRMARELFTLRKINVRPLPATPVLCVYGRHDRLLQQMGFSDWSLYESLIARICPNIEFRPMEGDHFLSGSGIRKKLIMAVDRFLSV